MDHPESVYKRLAGKGVFPHQMAFTLLVPLRNLFLSPRTLIRRLDLSDDHTVLEIGPGPGYFSVRIAKALSRGTLCLLDIQQEMLDYARKRLEKRGLDNVQYLRADGSTFPFGDQYFNRIFMVTVLGEVENQTTYIREIRRTLKDEGLVSVSELAGDPDKLDEGELKKLFFAEGFACSQEYRTLWGYTLNFKKRKIDEHESDQLK